MDYSNITDNVEVIKLLIQRRSIENQIMKLDDKALINYELERLSEPQANGISTSDEALPIDRVVGSLPDAELAKQLLEVRDQLVYGDVNEAYHILCKAADPDLTTLNHWEKWEKISGQ